MSKSCCTPGDVKSLSKEQEKSIISEAGAATGSEGRALLITVGNPNVGKTTLINAISGSRLRIGNWPGTTVERVETSFEFSGKAVHLVDLPGAYGLAASTAEEKVTRDEILHSAPTAVIDVIDSGNLERNLALTIELIEVGYPVVIAFNLIDEAKAKGVSPKPDVLAKALGVPVLPTVAVKEEGVKELLQVALEAEPSSFKVTYHPAIEEAVEDLQKLFEFRGSRWLALAALSGEDLPQFVPHKAKIQEWIDKLEEADLEPFLEISDARYRKARELASWAQPKRATVHRLTQKIDRWVLHPVLGIPIFLLGMFLLFRFTNVFSSPWVDFLGTVKDVLVGWVNALGLPEIVRSFLSDGLLEGVGTVIALTPVLFVLYFALSFMEASGFLARSAFLIDRLMRCMGLPGKAFIPLLVGFGCNVPGIAATKTLESSSERFRVGMAVPFASCSARMAVFAFFSSLFFPKQAALVMFGLYALGLCVGLGAIMIIGKVIKSDDSGSVMELPPYRIPTLKVLWRQASSRTMNFLEGAGGAILIAVLVVWVLLRFPGGGQEQSLFGMISKWAINLTAPLGITDWRLAGALIPGFVAKEVVIGTLAVSYLGGDVMNVMGFVEGLQTLVSALGGALWDTVCALPQLIGVPDFSPGEIPVGLPAFIMKVMNRSQALAYMVFVLLYTPCVATLSALKVEFGAKWAWISGIGQVFIAWIFAFLVSFIPVG